MIESIYISNFKSLGNVTLKLDKLTCLIGINGAGKSSVLQAVDFIAQLMHGRLDEWLAARDWSAAGLVSSFQRGGNIAVGCIFRTSSGHRLGWVATFNKTTLCCTTELVHVLGIGSNLEELIFKVERQKFRIAERPAEDIAFTYQGSLLSILKDSELTLELLEFRDALRGIQSLELLAPHLLRKRARTTDRTIGTGGEKLSAYLGTLSSATRATLLTQLQRFYPQLVDFKVSSLRSGWKKLTVIEQFAGRKLETDAAHLNDGLLRVLAVLTQAQAASGHAMILLDEIENGINQEVMEILVQVLTESPHQLLVTTHSPLLLNFLDDDQARQAVQFVYKSPAGETRIRPFFEIPRISDKLHSMGPGDAFVDTDLRQLTDECLALDAA